MAFPPFSVCLSLPGETKESPTGWSTLSAPRKMQLYIIYTRGMLHDTAPTAQLLVMSSAGV